MTLYTYGTILEEVQDALVQLSQVKPTGVFDSQDKNAILMGALANTIGPLLQVFPWQQFREEFIVVGDGVETSFDLPDDYARMVDDTGWSSAQRRPVVVVTAQSWAAVKAWLGQSFYINPAVRIFDDKMYFLTPPADGDNVTFEYVSKFWVLDEDAITKKYRLDANTDKPMYDSQMFMLALKLKWAGNKGLPTQEYQQDFDERFEQMTQSNQMASPLSLNGGIGGFRYLNGANVPNTGYGGVS
jgi:hypothetical protein